MLSENIILYSPMFLLKEIGRHRKEIRDKFGLNGKQFSLTLELIKSVVKFVPLSEFKEFIK
ncbi:MAG: hypothetical protein H5T50_02340 [Nitrososphaeria archaeon]|nr:hypothetical protein [Nitrososphaeria archaeon]